MERLTLNKLKELYGNEEFLKLAEFIKTFQWNKLSPNNNNHAGTSALTFPIDLITTTNGLINTKNVNDASKPHLALIISSDKYLGLGYAYANPNYGIELNLSLFKDFIPDYFKILFNYEVYLVDGSKIAALLPDKRAI